MQGVASPEDRRGKVDEGGKDATAGLERLALGRLVVCHLDGTTANRRAVGICFVDGRDLGAAMARDGYSRDCPAFSGGRYAEGEQLARADGRDVSRVYELPDYC